MVANKVRGEIEFKLGGQEFVGLPDFECIAKIESMTNKGVFQIYREMSEMSDKFTDIARVIYCAIHAKLEDKTPALKEIYGLILKEGYRNARLIAQEVIASALKGDEIKEKESKELAENHSDKEGDKKKGPTS